MTSGPSPASISVNADAVLEVDFGGQRRWTVLLRIILAIPQIVVFGLVSIAAFVVVAIGWFAALATGRLPRWAAEFLSGYVSWQARLYGYLQLLTDEYPPFSFTSANYPVQVVLGPTPATRPLILTKAARVLVIVFIVVGVLGYAGQIANDRNAHPPRYDATPAQSH